VKISVVIPTYNVVLFVDETLRSVRNAQNVDLEIIIVDDSSDDGTYELCQWHAKADPRIKVFRSPGHGGGPARNFGITQATGEYLMFCDGDDIVPPQAYRKLLKTALANDVDMVVGGYLKFFTYRVWDGRRNYDCLEYTPRTTLSQTPALLGNRACWNRLLRRSWWDTLDIEFPVALRINDNAPMTQALIGAGSISIIPDVVYVYRDRLGSGSMTAKRGQAPSMSSYLSQEARCAELCAQTGDLGIQDSYWKVFFREGSYHLLEYLKNYDPDKAEANAEVSQRLSKLLERAPSAAWERLDEGKQQRLRLVANGQAEQAATLKTPKPAKPKSVPPARKFLRRARRLLRNKLSTGK
jgi:glycosyltransferase involved in cell wall biosynthesis